MAKATDSVLRSALLGFAFLLPWAGPAAGANASNGTPAKLSDVRFFVVVKSSNYSQKAGGELTLLNYHFFSEVFPVSGAQLRGTLMSPHFDRPKTYDEKDRTLYLEGGHFPTLAALDAAYPNDVYRISIDEQQASIADGSVNFGDDGGMTNIPEPIHIAISQEGRTLSPTEIAPSMPTTVRWTRFSNGRPDPHGIVDDMIFVVIQDCRGRNVFHTGLPFDGKYLRYDASEAQVPAHVLEPGEPYSMFVEMPHVADSTRAQGIPGFASFATATYLDLHTLGTASSKCPAALPPMDTGQTDRAAATPATAVTPATAALLTPNAPPALSPGDPAPSARGQIAGQVTFLYYKDLAAPRRFYGEVLGLSPYFETEWVTLFHTAAGATIGLVKAPNSRATPAARRASVMVSLVTDDVAGWYRRLKQNGSVRIVKAPYDHPAVPIRAFEVEDPAGYPIEFFQWLDPAKNR